MRIPAAAALFAALALATPAGAQAAEAATHMEGARLTLAVTADVAAAPDIAEVNAGVVTEAATAEAAMAENAARLARVMAALKRQGLAERDIQTSNLTLNAQYRYAENQPPTLTGYQAQNTVSVTVRNLKGLGKAIDAVVAEGANQLRGVTFRVEKPDPVLDRARTEAIRKARARADLYAAAAGLRVARIVAIAEHTRSQGYEPIIVTAARAEMKADTPVAPGEVTLTADVIVTFELQ